MKKQVLALVVMGCLAVGAGGCAKHEIVKAEEPLAPSTTSAAPLEKQAVRPSTPAPVAPAPVNVAPANAQPAAPAAAAVSQAAELSASLEKIYFDFDSSTLSKEARDRLVKNAEAMKKDASVTVRIEGHCDERGSDDYNLALGEKRAKAALQYLTELGVPAERLSVISYGKEKPLDPGHDEAAWAKNRRDDFVIQ
jgi:peptidoglycan-associated lipoprotein